MMLFSKLRAAAIIPALVTGYLGLATPAHAEFCPPSFTLPNQQDGVCVTDQATTRVLFQTSSESAGQEVFVALSGISLLPGFNAGIVFLTEPGGAPSEPGGFPGLDLPGISIPSGLSDILALRVSLSPSPLTIDISFLSDGAVASDVAAFNAFAAGLPLLGVLPETGLWQDVSTLFGVATGSVFVQSDVDVPEPASLALLGAALLGFASIRRRKSA